MPETPATRCPRCGEVVQYVETQGHASRICPVCGEASPGTAAPPGWTSAAVTATPPAPVAQDGVPPDGDAFDPAIAPPGFTLASPGQAGWAAFLGGPIAGWLLIARNYAQMGRTGARWAAILAGVVVTAIAIAVAFALPDAKGTNLLPSLALGILTYLCAQMLQGTQFHEHTGRGGAKVSGWVVAGYILVGIVLILGTLIGGLLVYDAAFGDQELKVSHCEEILHGTDVTIEEAHALGRVLQQLDIFDGVGEKTVGLHKDGDIYVVSFVLLRGHQDAATHEEYARDAIPISLAFGAKPVRIELCDETMTAKKSLPVVRAPQ
jgi:hypothetical protein